MDQEWYLTRMLLQKGLAFIYLMGFLIATNQIKGLIGEKGIIPISSWIQNGKFWQRPSIFVWYHRDWFLQTVGCLGVGLSLFSLFGFSEDFGLLVSMGVWFILWLLYQSFVNVGHVFYGYGWEILLLESGFLAIFLGSADVAPPVAVIYLYRWVLFRVMFGAGMIKIRCDRSWRQLTTMTYHYETQPLPGPLSVFFHRLPVSIHKISVLFTHVIELVVPFFFFWPEMYVAIAGACTMGFQLLLICSGNLSWLNYVTLVLCFSCFSDSILIHIFPWIHIPYTKIIYWHEGIVIALVLLIAYLSIKPIKNLLSPRQVMNANFDPWNLVNTYGAFGSVTTIRKEIIIEGTNESQITSETKWVAYEFRAKPGDIYRRPPLVSPYHHKIDWQMWFAAMGSYQQHPWFLPFIRRLLEGSTPVIKLLRYTPFLKQPPRFIRATLYEYHFSTDSSSFWKRTLLGEYLPVVRLEHSSQEN